MPDKFVPRIAYRLKDAAAAVGVGKLAIIKAINAGQLRCSLVDDRRIIQHDDLIAWLDSTRAVRPMSPAPQKPAEDMPAEPTTDEVQSIEGEARRVRHLRRG